MTKTDVHPTKTVVVLGAAYGGAAAASNLARRLPEGWRVVAIDRQSHWNHVYPFPRFTIVPKHAPKAFLPRTNVFTKGRTIDFQSNVDEKSRTGAPILPFNDNPGPHRLVHAIITELSAHSVTFVTANAKGNFDDVKDDCSDAPADRVETIAFDYCVYALGGTLSAPSDVWGDLGRTQYPGRGSKKGGIEWLMRYNGIIQQAKSVLVVGGGALGIQFATDIKDFMSDKEVTLLHSRERLMPIYDQGLHDAVVKRCSELGIRLVLGERVLEWPEKPGEYDGKLKTVKTNKGTELNAELVLVCTGTKPIIDLVAKLDKDTIADNGYIRVKDTLQLATGAAAAKPDVAAADDASADVSDKVAGLSLDGTPSYDHIFAVGDCIDTTAIRAGHMSFAMGAVAARNILRLIDAREKGNEEPDLELYVPEAPRIKVSLGLKHSCIATPTTATESDAGVEDLLVRTMWVVPGAQDLGDNE